MSSKRNEKNYIKYLQSIAENVNTSHSKKYNIEAVSMLLKIPIVGNYKKQCELLLDYIKKSRHRFLKDLVKNTIMIKIYIKLWLIHFIHCFILKNFKEITYKYH